MRKLFLFLTVALFIGCADYTDDFNTINNRLDALEQSVPTIEEQIKSINTQLTSLKATDEAIKEQISELEKSNNATATEIADLKKKDSALEKSINDLQNYVDTQIANAKSEAAAAYATIEQYNAIVAQLNALQSSTSKLGEELTAKINAEVKSLNTKIADLEARLKAVEDKIENLLARIQSVSYIPTYDDGKATLKYISGVSQVVLDFKISPKECVAELAKIWESAIKVDAIYTETRAVSFVDMPIVQFEADVESGVISITASGENLSDNFFAGTQSASVALTISDGNNSVTSEYVPMVAQEGYVPKIELAQQSIEVEFEPAQYTVAVTSPYSWKAVSDNDWIEVETATGIAGTKELKFSVSRNEVMESREGTIVIKNSGYNLIAELYVIQKAFSQEAITTHVISFKTYPRISTPIAISAVRDSNVSDGKDFYEEYFANTKFIYDEKSGSYSGDTVKYWPLSGSMQYMALAPYHIHATATNHYNSDGSFEKIEITSIDNNLVNQHDILYSDLLEVSTPQTSAQPLLFHHAYAQLNVTFKKTNSAAEIILKSVKVNDVYINGQLTITPVVGGPSTAEWVVGLPVPRFFLPANPTSVESGTLDATLEAATPYAPQPVLVIPGAQTSLVIEYTIDGHDHTFTHTLSGDWEMGYKYTYNYTINVNEIFFDGTIEDWNSVDGGYITI